MTVDEVQPLPGIVDEALRLTRAATLQALPLRLVGGLAIKLRVEGSLHPALSRAYKDIDFVTVKGQGKATVQFLSGLGYVPDQQFNAFNGATRLLFHDLVHGRQVDVFVGAFKMCHEIPMTDRIVLDPVTIPLAELLLTKLQVVSLNEKDLRDTIAILLHHPIGDHDGPAINAQRIAELCSRDWGLWRTFKLNVDRAREGLGSYDLSADESATVNQRLDQLWERIEAEPKSRSWRVRDRIGDRKRWYEEPDEVEM